MFVSNYPFLLIWLSMIFNLPFFIVGIDPKAAKLQRDLISAIHAQKTTFTIQPADYDFESTSLVVNNAYNMNIIGVPGVTLWFGLFAGIQISNCIKLSISNITIDYHPTVAQGILVPNSMSKDRTSFMADFDIDFLQPDPKLCSFFASPYNHSIKIAFWDPSKRIMLRNNTMSKAVNIFLHSTTRVPTIKTSENTSRYHVVLRNALNPTHIPLPLPNGTLITIFPRGGRHSIAIKNCSHTTLTDVSIFGGSSMGILESEGIGWSKFDHLVIGRRPLPLKNGRKLDRLLSVNADGFHTISNAHGPYLINCDISFAGDDLGNTCGPMNVVLNTTQSQSNVIFIINNKRNLDIASSGDIISFYHLNTFVHVGTATIASAKRSTDPEMISAAKAARHTLQSPPYNAKFQDAAWQNVNPWKIKLRDPLPPKVKALWTLAFLERTGNSGTTVKNSSFHNGYARVWMIKSSQTSFTNNLFGWSGGVHLGPEQNWLEGNPGQTSVVVTNNTLQKCGQPAIELAPCLSHANITIKNNTIIP